MSIQFLRNTQQEYLLEQFFESDTEYFLVFAHEYCRIPKKTYYLFGFSESYAFPPHDRFWISFEEASDWFDRRPMYAIHHHYDELHSLLEPTDFENWTIEEYRPISSGNVVLHLPGQPESPLINDTDWDA